MKNYNMNESISNDKNEDKKSNDNQKTSEKKYSNFEVEEDYVLDDIIDNGLDDIIDSLSPTPNVLIKNDDENIIYDSHGVEVKIEKPIWKSNEKLQKSIEEKRKSGKTVATTPSWQKPRNSMSTRAWLKTIILILIPVLNIILLLYWSLFSDSVSDEKKNFSRALLLLVSFFTTIFIAFNIIKLKTFENNAFINNAKRVVSTYASDILNKQKDYTVSENGISYNEYELSNE